MRFDEFNEALEPSAKAAIKGMHKLSGDQYYGLYKTMKDVAGHDGKQQTAPNGGSDSEISDEPFAYAYTDEEKKMIKGVDPKAKQITSDKSEEVNEADEWEEQGDRWNRFQKWAVNQMLKATDKILTGNHVSQLENQYFGHPIQSSVQQTGFGSVDDGRKFTKFVQSIWDNWEEHRTQAAASNASDMLGDEGQKFLKKAYDDFMGMGEHSLQSREQHAIALSGYQVEHFNGKLFGTLGGNISGNRASMTPEIWGILEKAEADLVQKNIIDYDERRSQEDMKFWHALPMPVRVAIAAAMGKTPQQLEAILFNVKKEEPQVQGESAVQAKTDDKLLAYLAQRKAEKQKQNQQQGMAEDASANYIWIQGDFDGDTTASGAAQGSSLDSQSTQTKLYRGRMSNVRPLTSPPPASGNTIKVAKIPLTLDVGNKKFSTTGIDLQLTMSPNGYISQGEFGRIRGTAIVKIVPPGSEPSVAEAGRSYDDNRTGFAKPERNDDEHHELDAPRPLIYGLKINGKIWKKDGNVVTFFTKERALAARNSMLAKRPELEVGLVQRPKD